MKILTIIGARPQFIKAAMVSRAILTHNRAGEGPEIQEEIIHTGQHYDGNMSRVFFEQMQIPKPAATLEFGGLSHGAMTGQMLQALEQEILNRKPDRVLVYGDTNSTLAGSLAAAKLLVPVDHVEAGLRSFNKAMPEEINRIMTDHIADLLFCPTSTAVKHLATEGITRGVHHVGDVMYDAAQVFGELAEKESTILSELGLQDRPFLLATVHRAENTDDPKRLNGIFSALNTLATPDRPIVLPLHPRTAKILEQNPDGPDPRHNPNLRLVDPIPFLDMVLLEKEAQLILTDSGGVQKEAYFHRTPCVTLRDQTEWTETLEAGWNQLAGADTATILAAAQNAESLQKHDIPEYGAGAAGDVIVDLILKS